MRAARPALARAPLEGIQARDHQIAHEVMPGIAARTAPPQRLLQARDGLVDRTTLRLRMAVDPSRIALGALHFCRTALAFSEGIIKTLMTHARKHGYSYTHACISYRDATAPWS